MDICLEDKKSRISAGLLLADRIRDKITANELKVGQKLPPTEELSKMMNVSSHTVQKAMEILGNQGFIEGAPGRGRYVSSRVHQPNGKKSSDEQMRISVVNIFQFPEYGHPTDRFRIVSTEGVFSEASNLKISATAVPEYYYTASAQGLIENMSQTSSQGVLWLYPTSDQWTVVRELEENGIPVVITSRSKISENCACVEGDYESGGYAIGNHFSSFRVGKMVIFPGCDPADDSRKQEVLSQWPIGIHQGLTRALGIINGEANAMIEIFQPRDVSNAPQEVAKKMPLLKDGDGVIFVDSFYLFDYLQKYGKQAVSQLRRLNIVVVANEHLLGKFLQYRDVLDFYVLKDPLKEIARTAVQKLASLIQGYLANTSTVVKPSFERFKDMEIC